MTAQEGPEMRRRPRAWTAPWTARQGPALKPSRRTSP